MLLECVERFLKTLGTGFLRANGSLPYKGDPASLLYTDLLRLVYRFLFLMVAEERGLLGGTEFYREHYSLTRLRRLVDRLEAYTDHDDLWQSLRVLWHLLRDPTPAQQLGDNPVASFLGLPVLDGGLFEPLKLEELTVPNRYLLEAFYHLVYYYDEGARTYRRVNYAALDVEELGSVYESLLDNHPEIVQEPAGPAFRFSEGMERKSTGSYYTPPELVQELVKSALEPVLAEKLKHARDPQSRRRAILTLRVLDPACGSGHFLLAAARRLGRELAQIETGEDEPSPEALREAVREVITHCIYGVDKNPLAVELCKVALWIESHVPGKPLTFLDHRIRCGDSLVGVIDLKVLKHGIPDGAYDRSDPAQRAIFRTLRNRNRQERTGQMNLNFWKTVWKDLWELAAGLREISEIPDEDVEMVADKAARYERVRLRGWRDELACHLWTAAFFWDVRRQGVEVPTTETIYACLDQKARVSPRLLARAQELANRYRFFHWALEFSDVLNPERDSGFDVIIGNPPFMGGLRISGYLGEAYRRWLENIFDPFRGTADLCAAFYRRAFSLLRPGGRLGMVATNTIGQGDTRESGLAPIVRNGGVITFARRFIKWPGAANVEVNLVVIVKMQSHEPPRQKAARVSEASAPREMHQPYVLDGHPVPFISSRLDPEPEAEPKRLPQNEGKAFIGDYVRGIGFVLEPVEAEALLAKDPQNQDCLFPYLNGEDLNSHPEQKPSRWVICFHDWPLERARQYPDLLRIVEERVKLERERLRNRDDRHDRENWWRFARYRGDMRQAIAPLRRVLVISRVTEHHAIVLAPARMIFADRLVVFVFDDFYHFALLQSSPHEIWARRHGFTLESRYCYAPSDAFDTFPFPMEEYRRMESGECRVEALPEPFRGAAQVGAEYHEHRRQIMLARNIGLTKTYNLFHDPACTDADIQRLRELHAEMDNAILACYGWADLDLQHDFYQNERGQTRFTLSGEARREVIHRLLEQNVQIAALEAS